MDKPPRCERHSRRQIRVARAQERRLEREKLYLELCEIHAERLARTCTNGFIRFHQLSSASGEINMGNREKCMAEIERRAAPKLERRLCYEAYMREAFELEKSARLASLKLLDIALALASLRLPAYVLMFIVDWLPGFAHYSEFNKITLLQSVAVAHRSLPETRRQTAFYVEFMRKRREARMEEVRVGCTNPKAALSAARRAVESRLPRIEKLIKERKIAKRRAELKRTVQFFGADGLEHVAMESYPGDVLMFRNHIHPFTAARELTTASLHHDGHGLRLTFEHRDVYMITPEPATRLQFADAHVSSDVLNNGKIRKSTKEVERALGILAKKR
jgi:hypothetical protein